MKMEGDILFLVARGLDTGQWSLGMPAWQGGVAKRGGRPGVASLRHER